VSDAANRDALDAIEPVPVSFTGSHGNRIVGDRWGEGGRIVLLAHGGGQTRHSWDETARRMVAHGMTAIAIDHRGHGDSAWDPEGRYDFITYSDDLAAVARQILARYGARPVLVGASLGGIAGMMSQGSVDEQLFEAIVLVDITPRMDRSGVEKIIGFMAGRMEEGFASVEEAAEAVARYMPHRKRPSSHEGLRKNLRLHEDGRYRWHWDPKFVTGRQNVDVDRDTLEPRLMAAAANLTLPVMLVRGKLSELVSEEHVKEFVELVPHAEYCDVSGAGHMIAGDRNDVFADAVIGFIEKL